VFTGSPPTVTKERVSIVFVHAFFVHPSNNDPFDGEQFTLTSWDFEASNSGIQAEENKPCQQWNAWR
jgi:hypothetical protein